MRGTIIYEYQWAAVERNLQIFVFCEHICIAIYYISQKTKFNFGQCVRITGPKFAATQSTPFINITLLLIFAITQSVSSLHVLVWISSQVWFKVVYFIISFDKPCKLLILHFMANLGPLAHTVLNSIWLYKYTEYEKKDSWPHAHISNVTRLYFNKVLS